MNFKPKEVIAIIREAGNSGVKSLSFAGIELEFHQQDTWNPKVVQREIQEVPKAEAFEQSDKALIMGDKVDNLDDGLSELVLTDPVAFDRFMQSGGIRDEQFT